MKVENSMKKLIIGVDLDGCVGDYYDSLRHYVGKQLGIPKKQITDIYPDPKTYDMVEWPDFERDFIKYHTEAVSDGLFKKMKPIPGASQVLWNFNETGHHLRIITSRFVSHGQNAKVVADTAYWLDKNEIPYRDIMFVKRKTDVYADVYIDDSPENIQRLKKRHPKSLVIIFDATYNRKLKGPRAQTWEEVQILVEEYATQRKGKTPLMLKH